MDYLIEDKEKFLEMRQAWKDHANEGGTIRPEDHIIYNAIRGYDLKRGFTPIVKQARLDAGHRHAFDLASQNLRWQVKMNNLKMRQTEKSYPYFSFGLPTEEMVDICTRISL
jgi:hypothetical protein